MIEILDPTEIDVFSLPYVSFSDRKSLPDKPGLYFAVKDGKLLYLGKAENKPSENDG